MRTSGDRIRAVLEAAERRPRSKIKRRPEATQKQRMADGSYVSHARPTYPPPTARADGFGLRWTQLLIQSITTTGRFLGHSLASAVKSTTWGEGTATKWSKMGFPIHHLPTFFSFSLYILFASENQKKHAERERAREIQTCRPPPPCRGEIMMEGWLDSAPRPTYSTSTSTVQQQLIISYCTCVTCTTHFFRPFVKSRHAVGATLPSRYVTVSKSFPSLVRVILN